MASKHYVNNQRFLEELKAYRLTYFEAKADGRDSPILPDYIGECFMLIAEKLSHRPNFINYAFREDMISDGIENCLQYVNNFDPEKSSNPFAYFTQIIYYAFLRRIQKEKKQLYIKYKTIDKNRFLEDNVDYIASDSVTTATDQVTMEKFSEIYDFIENFEEYKRKKSKKSKATLFKEEEKNEDSTSN
tara:strand:- start:1233 stop:1796 length:564 start_codon:yes stop_codon:yes gene_type:complete